MELHVVSSGCILKVIETKFADRSDVGCKSYQGFWSECWGGLWKEQV